MRDINLEDAVDCACEYAERNDDDMGTPESAAIILNVALSRTKAKLSQANTRIKELEGALVEIIDYSEALGNNTMVNMAQKAIHPKQKYKDSE